MSRKATRWALAALLVTLTAARPSWGGDDAVARAKRHFTQGQQAYAEGRFDKAYAEYEAGWKLTSRPGFLLNMAQAKRQAGELREARDLFRRFLIAKPDAAQRDEVISIISQIDVALAEEGGEDPAGAADAPAEPEPSGDANAQAAGEAEPEEDIAPAPELSAPVPAPPAPVAPVVNVAEKPKGGGTAPHGEKKPIYRRPWFWAGAGAVVTGLALGVAFAAGGGSGGDKDSGTWGALRR